MKVKFINKIKNNNLPFTYIFRLLVFILNIVDYFCLKYLAVTNCKCQLVQDNKRFNLAT